MIKIENTWMLEIKEQASQLTLLYFVGLSEAASGGVSQKKLFLKILQYPQKTPVLKCLFKKIDPNYLKETPTQLFSCEYCKRFFWKTFANSCFLTISVVHYYMGRKVQGIDCIMASGFRVQVTVFELESLVLNQVLTCLRKVRRIPLMSQLIFNIG